MNINKIFSIYFTVLILFIFSILGFYRFFYEIPKQKEAISFYQQKELNNLNFIFNKNFEKIQNVNYYYSTWDDSYEYLVSKNEYYKTNYNDSMLINLKFNGVIIVDNNYNIVFNKYYDQQLGKSINIKKKIRISHIGEMYPDEGTSISKKGYIYLNGKYMIYSVNKL